MVVHVCACGRAVMMVAAVVCVRSVLWRNAVPFGRMIYNRTKITPRARGGVTMAPLQLRSFGWSPLRWFWPQTKVLRHCDPPSARGVLFFPRPQ
eukprot:scaffold1678_cov110-Isochrysis_galbana.AAC.3